MAREMELLVKITENKNRLERKMLTFITLVLPNLLVRRPIENREIIAAADRNERIEPITTGLIPFSVPISGRTTTKTSLVEATASEIQTAGLIPGRVITSLAFKDPAARRVQRDPDPHAR